MHNQMIFLELVGWFYCSTDPLNMYRFTLFAMYFIVQNLCSACDKLYRKLYGPFSTVSQCRPTIDLLVSMYSLQNVRSIQGLNFRHFDTGRSGNRLDKRMGGRMSFCRRKLKQGQRDPIRSAIQVSKGRQRGSDRSRTFTCSI